MAGQDTLIYIEDNDTLDASISAKNFAKQDIKNRAYFNTLGAKLIKKYLVSENIDIADTYNIHSIQKILEEVDISDVMLKNIHIDVRVVFNENYIFVPKSHFSYDILPDIYVVLLMSNDEKYMTFLGFFEPKMINKNNQNEEYYFIEKEKLTSPTQLKDYIQNFQGSTDNSISDSELEASDIQILSLVDQDITDSEKKQLLKNLVKSAKLRDRFIEFENFELLAYKAEHSPDVIKAKETSQEIAPTTANNNNSEYDEAAAATAAALEELDALGMAASITSMHNKSREENQQAQNQAQEVKMEAIEGLTEVINNDDDDILNTINEFNDDTTNIADAKLVDSNTQSNIDESEQVNLEFPDFEELSFDEDIIIPDEILNEHKAAKETNNVDTKSEDDDLEAIASSFNDIKVTQTANKEHLVKNDINPETVNLDDFELKPKNISTNNTPNEASNVMNFDEIVGAPSTKTSHMNSDSTTNEILDLDAINSDIPQDGILDLDAAMELDDLSMGTSEDILSMPSNDELPVDLDTLQVESSTNEVPTELNDISLDDNIVNSNSTELEELSLDGELDELKLDEELSLDEPEMKLDDEIIEMKEEIQGQPVQEEVKAEISETQPEIPSQENIQEEVKNDIPAESKTIMEALPTEEILAQNQEEDINLDDIDSLISEEIPQNDMLTEETIVEEEVSSTNTISAENAQQDNTQEQAPINNAEADEELDKLLSSDDFQTAVTEKTTTDADSITDLDLNAEEVKKATNTEGAVLEEVDTDDTKDLISQIDDLLGTDDSEEQNKKPDEAAEADDDDDKLKMLFNNNSEMEEDYSSEEYSASDDSLISSSAVNSPEKGKKAVMFTATALAAIFLSAAGVGFYLKGKNADIVSNNPIESDTPSLPIASPSVDTEESSDINDIMNAPATNPTPAPQEATNAKPVEAKVPTSAPTIAKPTPAKPQAKTPVKYGSVRSLTWEVPDYLSYSDKVKKYLQTAGRSIKLSLSSDLLLAKEYAYSNQIKVEIKLKNNGTITDAQIVKSSGSNEINEIVLRTVKQTLEVVKPAPGEIPTANFKLGLIINL